MTISNNPRKSIFFWRGCLDPQELLNNQEMTAKVREVLSNQCTRGTDLKKLRNHNIYRIKTNKKGRILFADYEKGGKHYMLLLDYLPDHKYEKSKYLNPKIAEKFRSQDYDPDTPGLMWEAITHDEMPELFETTHARFTLSPLDYYKSSFIAFNDFQGRALEERLPLLVSGPPGSGKTCVALSSLTNYLSNPENQNGKHVVYVSFSEALAKTMEGYWNQLPLSEELGSTQVQFIGYNTLLKTTCEELGDSEQVTEQEVHQWLREKKVPNPKSVIEEFQILSPHTKEEYLALGARQCLYHTREEKENIWKLFGEYKAWLREQNKYDIRFMSMNRQGIYDLMVVDEAQDLSPLALLCLFNLAKEGQISYFMDTQQDLEDSLSKRIHLKQLMYANNVEMSMKILPTVYRCPSSVLRLANRWLGVKALLLGGIADKEEYREILLENNESRNEGTVSWCTEKFEYTYIDLRYKYKETEIAIIAETKSDKALKSFKKHLLFTAEEIKGLEFPAIMLFKPFEARAFREINKGLEGIDEDELQGCRHRAKKTVGTELKSSITPALSKVFTSITRAEDSLILYQPLGHQVKNIHRLLHTKRPEELVEIQETYSCTSSSVETTREDWLQLAKRYLDAGQEERFRAICQSELQADPEAIRQEIQGEHTMRQDSASKTTSEASLKRKKKRIEETAKKPDISSKVEITNLPVKAMKQYSIKQQNSIIKCAFNGNSKALRRSLKRGYNIDFTNYGATPLIVAITAGHKDVIELLLDHGANICLQNDEGDTAISIAAKLEDEAILKLLLENKPQCPFAAANRRYHCAQTLEAVIANGVTEIAKILIDSGIRVNHTETNDSTYLMIAAIYGQIEIARYLIDKGAVVDAKTPENCTTLMIAANHGNVQMVELLLNSGANVNLMDRKGWTSLMIAAGCGFKKIVELLIERGANVNLQSKSGCTAIKLAAQDGNKEIVRILLEALQKQSQ